MRKIPYNRILKREVKQQYISTVPKPYIYIYIYICIYVYMVKYFFHMTES